ncbi:MAG: class I SAM-dependent methyltransferase [Aggregatilineales bacterium]
MSAFAPFDSLAGDYDRTFSDTLIGRWLRARAQARLAAHFNAGDRVLEIGCGTGLDTLFLAQRGVSVTATDASPAMLSAAQARIGPDLPVTFARLDLNALPPDGFCDRQYDGAFASFGPVNAATDLTAVSAWLATRVRPGGAVCLGVMGPLCLWEIVWHGLHGDFKTARRRLGGQAQFAPPAGPAMTVRYPSVNTLTQGFAPWFARARVESLGLFLPPSDVYGVVERRPRLLRLLTALEARAAGVPSLARLADHYWIELVRV